MPTSFRVRITMNRQITAADISKLTANFPCGDSSIRRRFALEYLEIDDNDYKKITYDQKDNCEDMVYAFLQQWKCKRRKEGEPTTVQTLVDLLDQVDTEHADWFQGDIYKFLKAKQKEEHGDFEPVYNDTELCILCGNPKLRLWCNSSPFCMLMSVLFYTLNLIVAVLIFWCLLVAVPDLVLGTFAVAVTISIAGYVINFSFSANVKKEEEKEKKSDDEKDEDDDDVDDDEDDDEENELEIALVEKKEEIKDENGDETKYDSEKDVMGVEQKERIKKYIIWYILLLGWQYTKGGFGKFSSAVRKPFNRIGYSKGKGSQPQSCKSYPNSKREKPYTLWYLGLDAWRVTKNGVVKFCSTIPNPLSYIPQIPNDAPRVGSCDEPMSRSYQSYEPHTPNDAPGLGSCDEPMSRSCQSYKPYTPTYNYHTPSYSAPMYTPTYTPMYSPSYNVPRLT